MVLVRNTWPDGVKDLHLEEAGASVVWELGYWDRGLALAPGFGRHDVNV